MDFTFKHPVSGEVKTVYLSEDQIQHMLSEDLYNDLTCDCHPTGETNVVECGCDEYLEEFELQERSKGT